jgi:hypothetical protein
VGSEVTEAAERLLDEVLADGSPAAIDDHRRVVVSRPLLMYLRKILGPGQEFIYQPSLVRDQPSTLAGLPVSVDEGLGRADYRIEGGTA